MGSIIDSALGTYVVTDQSKKDEHVGSYLNIRASIDISKPLRRSLLLRIDGEQRDIFHPDYWRSIGCWFGLSPERHWSIQAPSSSSVSDFTDVDMILPADKVTSVMERSTGLIAISGLGEATRVVTAHQPTEDLGSPSIPVLLDLNCLAHLDMEPLTELNINWGNFPTSTPIEPCMVSHVNDGCRDMPSIAWDLNLCIDDDDPNLRTSLAPRPLSLQAHTSLASYDQNSYVGPPSRVVGL
ncbi:unnamed protein product [Prunus armeniaca]|uniref:Uncharacterized protein n=1 Tax=Prunus armeniaca TaxID=36596 RepID=A0A6J5XUA6_PRUAR|nr:unnamed protein product [Prunus armeniaca]